MSLKQKVVVAFLAILGSILFSPPPPAAHKFQVGDCIQYQSKYFEIWDDQFPTKIILSIGNHSYRVAYFSRNIDTNSKNKVFFSEEPSYEKVSCNE